MEFRFTKPGEVKIDSGDGQPKTLQDPTGRVAELLLPFGDQDTVTMCIEAWENKGIFNKELVITLDREAVEAIGAVLQQHVFRLASDQYPFLDGATPIE